MIAAMERIANCTAIQRAVAIWRRCELSITPWLGGFATVLTLAIIAWQLRAQDFGSLASYIPSNPWFWLALVAAILIEPLCDWLTLRRLLGLGTEAVLPLIRKQSLNDLIFGYLGDAYFMAWLQHRIEDGRRAFAIVCDLAAASSLANSAVTLVMLAVMWAPLRAIAGKGIDTWAGITMLAVILVPAVVLAWSRVRAGTSAGLGTILLFQILRTVAVAMCIALTWHFALPAVPVSAWLLLSAGRMIVSRIPIVPNKDLAFVACATLFAGAHPAVAPMIASVTFLMLTVQALFAVATYIGPPYSSHRETSALKDGQRQPG